ncbi:unnamed protein product [Adineta steineri]|uniref:Uncharacterized protein n=1 Tax=Adineta steineri TaxID=433720 RepID=A0A814LP96_9BILA|nr:unnamed protein product [Adineta steineri]
MLPSGTFVLVVIATIIIHCNSAPTIYTITKQQYTTIQIGWTRNQVTNLVGSYGAVIVQTSASSGNVTIVQYTGTGTTAAVVLFGFVDGQLISKSEASFDSPVNNKITLQQYKTIQIGWTQQQVTQLLGGPGNIISQTGTSGLPYQATTVQYFGLQSSTARDQVTNLVGSSGNAVSEAGTANTVAVIVQYTGLGTTYGLVAFGFVSGKVVSKFEVGLDLPVSNKITLQQYKTIQSGWTQQQVAVLLGGPGTIVSQVGALGPYQLTTVQYTGLLSSTVIADFVFIGGTLSSKAQIGLDTGVYTINYQQYTAIQVGWIRDQVTSLVGSAGNAVSEATAGNTAAVIVQYTGCDTVYGIATISFVGGKVISKSEFGIDPPASNKITLQQYKTIQSGWTQQQVAVLLGGPGTIVSQVGTPGPYQLTTVQYSGLQSSTAIADFVFIGGSLSSKAQIGLDTGVYAITNEQYTAIQVGWTRDQVTSLVGSTGNAMSEGGTGSTAVVLLQYTVPQSAYGQATFIFISGKLSSKSKFGFK